MPRNSLTKLNVALGYFSELLNAILKSIINTITMRTTILTMLMIGMMTGTVLTSCRTAAKEDLKEAKEDMRDVGHDLDHARKDMHNEVSNNVKDEWNNFYASAETAVTKSEKNITELRTKISTAEETQRAKLNEKLDNLETKNKVLKERIAEHGRMIKANAFEVKDWTKKEEKEFQAEFKHDMDELGTALKDLFTDNI